MNYNSTWWLEYKKFIASPAWQVVRSRAFRYYGRVCYCCKTGYGHIQIHHLNYENYKSPSMQDIRPLCSTCHQDIKRVESKHNAKGLLALKIHMNQCKIRLAKQRRY
jgi:predicted HNH restriction endonuclease